MKAALIMRQGEPVAANVKLQADHPDPVAGPGQVVVRTEAAALNHLDLWVGRGVPGLELDYPRISGSDGCGIVEAIGDGVEAAWMGRRVILNAAVEHARPEHPLIPGASPDTRMIGEHDPGCMAERFVAPVANLAALDDDADPVHAAAFGLTHLTAWRMLVTGGGLRSGHTVLITGIGGGVALASLNICRHHGCPTIVTSRHQSKLDRALELGADHAILETGDDWSKRVRELTHRRGVDICADSIGKVVFDRCIKSLSAGGSYVTCGCTSGPEVTVNLARLFWFQQKVIGSTMGDMEEFRQIVSLLRSGWMEPVIDSVFDFADVGQAFARLESGEQFGKVVVRWS